MKDKYVIVDLRNMDYMKNEKGQINFYETEEDAVLTCGMYEFEDAWVMKLIYNHKEPEIDREFRSFTNKKSNIKNL